MMFITILAMMKRKYMTRLLKRTMLMFMEDYIYSETKIVLCIENVEFKLTGNVAKRRLETT